MRFSRVTPKGVMMKSSTLLLALILFSGCQRSGIGATSSQSDENVATIEVDGVQVADGVTPSTINIWLKNFKGEPLIDREVEIEVSGRGNTLIPCTKTDLNGRAQCWLVTTFAENKIVSLKGTDKTVAALFNTPKENRDGATFVAAGDSQVTLTGASFTTAVDLIGPFENQTTNQDFNVRTTHLSQLFAEIQ